MLTACHHVECGQGWGQQLVRLLRGVVLKQSLSRGRLALEEHIGRRQGFALPQISQTIACANAASGLKIDYRQYTTMKTKLIVQPVEDKYQNF